MKDAIKVICVLLGSIIGAGFASGREMYLFFNSHGQYGLIGIIVSTILTIFLIQQVLKIMTKERISTYSEFLHVIGSKSKVIPIIINLFLLISFYVMIAGFSAYFSQELNIAPIFGAIVISTLCYFVLLKNINGIVKINVLLIPIIIVFVFYLGGRELLRVETIQIHTSPTNWFLDAILYASYNSIGLIPIILTLKNYVTKKSINKISKGIGFILLALGMCIFFLLTTISILDIGSIELPMVYLASTFGKLEQYGYGIVILIAIFTSAVADGYGLLENSNIPKKWYPKVVFLLCFSAIFVSPIGFSNLVDKFYPIFGYLGLLQVLLILKKRLLDNSNLNKKRKKVVDI